MSPYWSYYYFAAAACKAPAPAATGTTPTTASATAHYYDAATGNEATNDRPKPAGDGPSHWTADTCPAGSEPAEH